MSFLLFSRNFCGGQGCDEGEHSRDRGNPLVSPLGKTLLVVVLVGVVVVLVKLYLLLVHKYNAKVKNAIKLLQYKEKLIN